VLLAWNTEVTAREDKIETEYQALWRRLGDPLDLPGLEEKDVWPFAEEYLKHAQRRDGELPRRKHFREMLKQLARQVVEALRDDAKARLSPQSFASYRVLHHWREAAARVARALLDQPASNTRG